MQLMECTRASPEGETQGHRTPVAAAQESENYRYFEWQSASGLVEGDESLVSRFDNAMLLKTGQTLFPGYASEKWSGLHKGERSSASEEKPHIFCLDLQVRAQSISLHRVDMDAANCVWNHGTRLFTMCRHLIGSPLRNRIARSLCTRVPGP